MTIAAFRYNNPFDVSLPIAGYSGPGTVAGIQGQKGYASFPDMSTGYGAGVQRLHSYISGQSSYGPKSTINELNSVYATDPNWSHGVAKFSGIGADDKLDPNDPAQMSKLQYGVLAQEIGPDNAAKVIQGFGGTAPSPDSQPTPAAQASAAAPSQPAGLPPPQQQQPIFPQQQAPVMPQGGGGLFSQMPAQIQTPQIYYAPRRQYSPLLAQNPIFSQG